MRFRFGLLIGFGSGYYLGARAGRERYEDINRFLDKVKRSDAYDTVTDKARAVVDLGVERARDVVEEHRPGNGSAPADIVTRDEPLARSER